ncbi:AI-2E family transporter [Sphingomonas oleivorans]|uniref:AI-2E family transporter n=1 Tax=Sphingomonas oleivorans TaxID=1735121 RepID=A0A2T5FZM0_9SPHN|nr:AI-2E family transporter [Sphingomonas oleivorans]PTQ12153.1 AI-2E family transporter [Sphingomonas oleivorans]
MRTAPVGIAQVITGTAAGMALLYFLRSILIPVVVAFVLAILVNALVRSIGRRWPRSPGWAVVALAGAIIGISAFGAIYVIAQGGVEIAEQGPALVARLDQLVEGTGRWLGLDEPLHLSNLVGRINVPRLAGDVLAGVQDIVSGVFLMIVYFGFMLASRARIAPKVRNIAASSDHAQAIRAGMGRIAADIETYVSVQTLTGLMLAGISGLVMVTMGLDNALFWAIILFLLSYIPIIGVTIGSVVPALFALLQFPTVWPAVVVFGGIQVAAFVIGNLIYPRMQADTQNIDPVATILALSFWSFLWGMPGAFLAVPLTLMLMMVCTQFESTRWIAVLLSNDGQPHFPHALRGSPAGREQTEAD